MALPPLSLKLIASGALAANLIAQSLAVADGSMMAVHEAHVSVFTPLPTMVAAFFGPVQLLGLAWLVFLWRQPGPETSKDAQTAFAYALPFAGVSIALAGMSLLQCPSLLFPL